jgi:Phosphatidylglycerol lysyltransferase, C-terminal
MLSTVDAVAAFGDNPSAFLALNSEKSYFTAPGLAGFVAYRRHGRYLVQFAGPFAPPADYPALLRGFLRFAEEQRRRVVAIQLQRADAETYAAHGFVVNQIGASYAVRLADFSLRGGRFMRLRNKISRARRTSRAWPSWTGSGCAARAGSPGRCGSWSANAPARSSTTGACSSRTPASGCWRTSATRRWPAAGRAGCTT